jgi:hypothetical protein
MVRERGRLLYEELIIYTPHIIRVIKSKRIRWVGHAERMKGARNAYELLSENLSQETTRKRRIDGKTM